MKKSVLLSLVKPKKVVVALNLNLIKADYWEIEGNCRNNPYEYINRRELTVDIEINGFKGADDKFIGFQRIIFIPRADGTRMIIETYNTKDKMIKSVEKVLKSARDAISVYERGFKAKDGNKLPILYSVEIVDFERIAKKKNLTLED